MASMVSASAISPGGSGSLVQSSGLLSFSFSVPVPHPSPAPASSSLRRCKGFSSKQSLFRSGCPDHRYLLRLLPDSQLFKDVPAKSFPSHIVCSRKRSSASDLLATLSDEGPVQKSRQAGWDGQKALIITEGVCIVVAGASYSMSVLNKQQTTLIASSSAASDRNFLPKFNDPSTWCVPALWVALIINAVLRTWQRRPSTRWDERNIKDFTLDERVGKLEEDVEGMTTTSRMLSRHLEKLGVRFRATKRTLRDPVQEGFAKSSESASLHKNRYPDSRFPSHEITSLKTKHELRDRSESRNGFFRTVYTAHRVPLLRDGMNHLLNLHLAKSRILEQQPFTISGEVLYAMQQS